MKHIISCGLALSVVCSMQAMEVTELSPLQKTLVGHAVVKKGKKTIVKEINEGTHKQSLSGTETAYQIVSGLFIEEKFSKPKNNAKDFESTVARAIFDAIEQKEKKPQTEKADVADYFVGQTNLLDNIHYDLDEKKITQKLR